jgi:hypothetical protein
MHIAEPLVSYPTHFETEITSAKLRSYKLPGSDLSQNCFKQDMKY